MLQAPLPQGRSRSDTYPVNMYPQQCCPQWQRLRQRLRLRQGLRQRLRQRLRHSEK